MVKLTEAQLLSIKKVSFIYLTVITVSIALARTPFFETNYNSSSKQEVAIDSNSNNDDLEKAEFLRLLSAEGDISAKEEGNTDEVKPKEKVGRVDSSGETQNKKKRPEAPARVDNTSTRRSEQVEESSSKIPINNHELNESYVYLVEKDPKTFLYYHSEKPWAQPYIDSAAENMAEIDPKTFLHNYSNKPWAEPYVDLAARNLAELNPKFFLEYYSKEPWAKPYIDLAAKKFAKKDPKTFLYYHSEKPWAQPYVDLAAKIIEEELSD